MRMIKSFLKAVEFVVRYWLAGKFCYLSQDKEPQDAINVSGAKVAAFADEERAKLNLKHVLVLSAPGMPGVFGRCMLLGHVVLINPVGNDHVIKTLRHELRHAWQHQYHGSKVNWCWRNMGSRTWENDAFYWLSLAEIDARYYAESGDVEGVFSLFSVQQLEQMKKDGALLPTMYRLAEECGVLPELES